MVSVEQPRLPGRRLAALALGSGATALLTSLLLAPTDAVQGASQRLMYVHVPAAWVAYLAFGVVLVSSIAYLVRYDLRWDARAQVAAELGVGLTALTIVLGSIWGRVTWGVWWAWDARLTTTVVLLLTYLGYLLIRALSGNPHTNAHRCAVVGVLGFVTVPLVHVSVLWWRTLHQPPTVLGAGFPHAPIDPLMGLALAAAVLAFTTAAAWVFLTRVHTVTRRHETVRTHETLRTHETVRQSAPVTRPMAGAPR